MLSKGKNTEKSNAPKLEVFDYVHVNRCHDFGNGRISFNATFGMIGAVDQEEHAILNAYNLTWIEGTKSGRDYKFVSMPQKKGNDGNYYNEMYINIDDKLLDQIESELSDMLN